MRLTKSASLTERNLALSCLKTSPDYLATRREHSAASLLALPAKVMRSSQQGENGRTLVVCLDPKEQRHGGSRMPNITDWPNDAAVCSLSQVLVRDSIPPQYFLSSTACAGILRRAEKRGKALPTPLLRALRAVAEASSEPEIPAAKTPLSQSTGSTDPFVTMLG